MQILKCYEIPHSISFYRGSRCAVRAEGEISEWFEVITGVRQGCVFSQLIFLMVMDWILRRTTAAISAGIQWIGDSNS